MSIKIVHARMDENGKIDGPLVGDQTGKEILEERFYLNDSVYLLICKDADLAERALEYAIQIANDNNYGYSQGKTARLSGLKSILANGGVVQGGSGSFDCATFVLACYYLAGLPIKTNGYTGNLRETLEASGMFDVYKGAPYIASDAYARRGSLYLRPKTSDRGGHVFMVAQDGAKASDIEVEDFSGEADQIDPPYVQITGSVNVRFPAGLGGKVIYVARDEKLPFEEVDADTGWYGVQCPQGPGFVSNRIPAYAQLVKE